MSSFSLKNLIYCVLFLVFGSLLYILVLSRFRVNTQNWTFPTFPQHNDTALVPQPISMCMGPHQVYSGSRFAVASLMSGDFGLYGVSAMKLGKSIRKFTNVDMIMMILDSRPIHADEHRSLMKAGWKTCIVPLIEGPLHVEKNNRFLEAKLYSKFNAWKLIEYEAVLFLDSDTLVVGNVASAFTEVIPNMQSTHKTLGAARDRPANTTCRFGTAYNYFNAGVLLLVPNIQTFHHLHDSISTVKHNTDWAEQDLLNQLYSNSDLFYELPFEYNAIVTAKVCEPSVWNSNRGNIKIVHFTTAKGWMYSQSWKSVDEPFQCWWWEVQDLCLLWEKME